MNIGLKNLLAQIEQLLLSNDHVIADPFDVEIEAAQLQSVGTLIPKLTDSYYLVRIEFRYVKKPGGD